MTDDSGGFGRFAARWSSRGARLVLGVAISLLALLLSWAALLNIIIRDVPEPSSMAEDLVSDLAVGIGVADAQALEIAEEAVASLDGSYLNGSLDTADNIRLGILGLPWILLVLIAIILLITPAGWRRRRWAGWSLMLAGGGLVLLAALLDADARSASDGSAQGVLDTAREFIGSVLAPTWPIGLAALGVGFVLWLWGVVVLVRGEGPETAGD
jgi:hypothetical protein